MRAPPHTVCCLFGHLYTEQVVFATCVDKLFAFLDVQLCWFRICLRERNRLASELSEFPRAFILPWHVDAIKRLVRRALLVPTDMIHPGGVNTSRTGE